MNELIKEKSPYLQQHAHNPVHWRAWNEQTLDLAKKRNRPIFLSIGYSTCHWCHVMEKESFEDASVAEILNRFCVPVKLDREERPDLDAIYMTAVQAMTGHGGWPLSVWLTPDLKPFYGGTYFPKMRFIEILNRIESLWTDHPQELRQQATAFYEQLREYSERERTAGLGSFGQIWKADEGGKQILSGIVEKFMDQFLRRFDEQWGGFEGAPKFPPAMTLLALMRIGKLNQNLREPVKKAVKLTLNRMSWGGIYDHLGGGFHRYSTDEQWLVPHFEKMLYDNALLATCYLEAYVTFGDPHFKVVAEETLQYVIRDLTVSESGFF